jgi:predicted small metal-binding protein
MHTIVCQEVSGLACPFVAKGETMEEAMMELKSHGMEMHMAELSKMMSEGMTEEMMMNKMKEAAKTE